MPVMKADGTYPDMYHVWHAGASNPVTAVGIDVGNG
jgi:hypothetical protein